ncbi:alpha/beta fold hydrolase [Streptomyces sp. NPDC004250]|uniref:alpha/beta fold hydrolase n=1 Tax=Streptomyces sp. NPDC004250 TaxID=3364692 RepID=UPI0036B02D8D
MGARPRPPPRARRPATATPRTVADLAGWLDALLDGLGIRAAALGGHPYGAWIALSYALHAPDRYAACSS